MKTPHLSFWRAENTITYVLSTRLWVRLFVFNRLLDALRPEPSERFGTRCRVASLKPGIWRPGRRTACEGRGGGGPQRPKRRAFPARFFGRLAHLLKPMKRKLVPGGTAEGLEEAQRGPMVVVERLPLPKLNFVLHHGSPLRHESTLSSSNPSRVPARSVFLCLVAPQIPSSSLLKYS